MKIAAFLLAAPFALRLVAADPRPTPGPNRQQIRRVLERWNYPRQTAVLSETGGAATSDPPPASSEKPTSSTPAPTPTPPPTSSAPVSTSTPAPTSTPDNDTSTPVSSPTSTPQNTPTSQVPATPTPTPVSTPQSQPPTQPTQTAAPPPQSTPSPTSSQLVTTNEQGRVFTSIIVITPTYLPTPSNTSDDSTPKPITKGTIIGLAVTGSIAVLVVILLIVWKLTNKRFSDLEDNGEDAIKWPEINKDSAAMTPLPTRPTARGLEANDDFDAQSSAAHSTADLTGVQYQPYSDDPAYAGRQYYDPYGAAPGTARPYPSPPGSHDGDHKNWGGAEGQAYQDPHQQYYDSPMRGPSPGPNMAYGDSLGRGITPAPNMAYGDPMARGASPGPNMAYADPAARSASPAPTAYSAYPPGYGPDPSAGGRRSPGPSLAYGGSQNDHGMVDPYGRRSPGPGMAYGGRSASPGPNVAYDQGGYR